MLQSRRGFLGSATAALLCLPKSALPATAKGERPLPELVPDADLPVEQLDVAASMAQQKLVLAGGKAMNAHRQGMIINIPSGVSIPLKWTGVAPRPNEGFVSGARIILRGEPGQSAPLLYTPGEEGLLGCTALALPFPFAFELENLRLRGGSGAYAVSAVGVRFVRLSGCSIEKGKDGLFFPVFPTVCLVEDSTFFHGGLGDGLTHNVYAGYIDRFTARRCTFKSPRAQGHALKCYARDILVRDCTIATWETTADRDAGYYGMLPPVDIGAWGNSRLINNTIIRRGPARSHTLEYRNRQYEKNSMKFVPPDWGTEVVDYHKIDNRDPHNPHLFNHFLVNNRFVNGVLPDGGLDPAIVANPGSGVRNNGSGPWASETVKAEPKPAKPDDFQPYNERAVVWVAGNRFEGVKYVTNYDDKPYNRPQDVGPIRELTELPRDLGVE